jgi:hypothetical protein
MRTYLLPIADREPLAWILAEQRTAFPPWRAREAQALQHGDRLLLYTTRGCFHNPTRDRGKVIGLASVTAPASTLRKPVRFGDREYTVGVPFAIECLAPFRQGVELAPLVPQLSSFPNPRAWSGRMRRALVPVTVDDANLLVGELKQIAGPYPEALGGYAA